MKLPASPLRSIAALGAGAAVAVAVAKPAKRQLAAVARIDPALRSPACYVPLPFGRATIELGQALQNLPAELPKPPAGISVERRRVPGTGEQPGVGVVVYRPDQPTDAALLWIHGGGYVLGNPAYGDAWCGEIAAQTGITVVSVDYRLAPKHPFPAALDDCMLALRWLRDRAPEFGLDPARVAIGGDSAGGGLAASLAQRCRDESVPVAFQLLEYPMLDDRTVQRAERTGEWNVIWDPRANRLGWSAYLGKDLDERSTPAPYAVAARRTDLHGLAPAWIGVGDQDLFHTEDVAYAERLRAADVDCDLVIVPGMYHAADIFAHDAPAMLDFRRQMLDALRHALLG